MLRGVTNITPNGIYTLRYVSHVLHVSVRTLERVVASGKLTVVRAGRHSFVTGRNLLAWLEGSTDGKDKGKRKPKEASHA